MRMPVLYCCQVYSPAEHRLACQTEATVVGTVVGTVVATYPQTDVFFGGTSV